MFGKKSALKFVVLLGLVSLFADVTYEGARSITGPYLATLGASGTAVGFVAGFGELVGYGLRLVSGILSDRTRRYWFFTILGYAVNVLAVPFLALAGRWEIAASLIICERFGKAIRTPARDAMLSHAAEAVGRGWAFGLHEAMDQIGAMLGPLLVALVIYFRGDYKAGFAALLVPALLAVAVLLAARFLYPHPEHLEINTVHFGEKGFGREFWVYCAASAAVAAGFADFPLVAFHFGKVSSVPAIWIPCFYAIAMGVDGLAALLFGRFFDRHGILVLVFVNGACAFFAPLVFFGDFWGALGGMMLWGIGMGAHESVMRAVVSGLVSSQRRATAFGIFNMAYGVFWFLGSFIMGILYDISIPSLIIFSFIAQWASLPLLFWLSRKEARTA